MPGEWKVDESEHGEVVEIGGTGGFKFDCSKAEDEEQTGLTAAQKEDRLSEPGENGSTRP